MDTTQTLDLRGIRCPLPIVRLNNQMKLTPPGQALEFIADDPAFLLDVQAWARRLGYPLTLTSPGGPEIRGTVCRP